eukprot:456889-Pleurochrysis_carterae.AAC.1
MNAVAERQSGKISEKVIQILRARKADNRRCHYNQASTPLTKSEKRQLLPNAALSHMWEQRSLARTASRVAVEGREG